MPILVGIDGTCDWFLPSAERNRAYDQAFRESFVRQICRNKPYARYFRGPVALGGGLPEAVNGGLAFILARRRQTPSEPILLTGYSRGAAGVVALANRLRAQNIRVRAMMLFDCVDRHLNYNTSRIPNNVDIVLSVFRHPATNSRVSFGYSAVRDDPPTQVERRPYMCTHGGMGGTPWIPPDRNSLNRYINEGRAEALASPTGGIAAAVLWYRTNVTYAQDRARSAQLWVDVQPFLRRHGF